MKFPCLPYHGHVNMHSILNTCSCPRGRDGGVCIGAEGSWGIFEAISGRTQSLFFPQSLPLTLAKAVIPSIFVSGKQVVSQSIASVPGDQDVEEEAKMIKTNLEKLCEESPLVLKEVSKVKSDVA